MPRNNIPADHRIARLCRSLYEGLRDHVYAEAAAQGFPDLRPAHSAVLRHIDPAGSRVVQLAERAGMTKQSMAYLTDSLTKLGYVAIGPDPDDRRAKRVALTTRGRGAVALLERLSWDAEAKISARLSPARLAALRADLCEALEAVREI